MKPPQPSKNKHDEMEDEGEIDNQNDEMIMVAEQASNNEVSEEHDPVETSVEHDFQVDIIRDANRVFSDLTDWNMDDYVAVRLRSVTYT